MTASTNPDFHWLELDLKVASSRADLTREAFLNAAGVLPAELENIDDPELSGKIWAAAEKITGRPEIGLDVLEELKLDDFGDLGLAAITSADLREAIQSLVSLPGATSRQWQYQFVDDLDHPSVVIEKLKENHRYSHHTVDSTIAIGVYFARELLGKSHYDIYRVNFQHPDFGLRKTYEERLGCPCRFGCAVDSVEFAAESLCHPMPLRNKELNDALKDRLKHKLSQEGDYKSRVTQAILELLNQQLWPNRSRVAELLNIGERTMLRRLAELDSTYRELQEAVLEDEAKKLLVIGISAEKVAERLCYANTSPLARMLKRRTGLKLSELRRTNG